MCLGLILGLVILNSSVHIQPSNGYVRAAPTPVVGSSRVGVLSANTTANPVTCSICQSFNLTGTWQASFNDGSNVSMTESDDYPCGDNTPPLGPLCTKYFVGSSYVGDSVCPAAVGQVFFATYLNSTGGITNQDMQLCTSATNAIVENCSQPQLWSTPFNATVSENSITGQFESQYWEWNTTSSGAIIPSTCHDASNSPEDFTLTRLSNSTTSSSANSTSSSSSQSSSTQFATFQPSTGSSQQSTGSSSLPPGGSSLVSNQPSSQYSTNSSTTTSLTKSGSAGPLGLEIWVAAAVVIVLIAITAIFLRWRPQKV